MYKKIVTIGLCLLLIGMPAVLGANQPMLRTHRVVENDDHPQQTPIPVEDPPEWANGNFSGVWGIDIWGEAQIPLGWLYGYYKRMNFGIFYGAFNEFGEEQDNFFLQGIFVGPFMFGTLGNDTGANDTLFVGLGGYDETNFYWRIMGQTGPTFFMYGNYSKFE